MASEHESESGADEDRGDDEDEDRGDDEDEDEIEIMQSPLRPGAGRVPSSSFQPEMNIQSTAKPSSAPAPAPAINPAKKAKLGLGEREPLYQIKFEKSDDHKQYERKHSVGAGIFGTVHIQERKGKNYLMVCAGCNWKRVGSIGIMLDHAETCKLDLVDEQSRVGHREYLTRQLRLFNAKNRRDMQTASTQRDIIEPTVTCIFKDVRSKREALLP
jgi:hypothetical protein